MSKKKIAIAIHKSDLYGGPGHSLISLLPEMQKSKLYEYLFIADHSGELTDYILNQGFRVAIIKNHRINKFFPFLYLLTVLRTVIYLLSNKIDLLHLQFDYYRDAYLLAAKLLKIPSVIHFRGQAGDEKLNWHNLATAYIYNSNFTRSVASHKNQKQFVVYNPVQLSKHEISSDEIEKLRESLSLSQSDKLILNVSRIHQVKNIEDYLKLAQAFQNQEFKFLIAGNIQDQNYYQQLQDYIAKENITNLIFLGHQKNLAVLYQAADLLVHTAKEEPFGRIFIEAGLARLPVLTYHSGGAREILDQDRAYLADNFKDLNELFIRLFSIDNEKMLNNNKKYIQDNFAPDIILKQTEEIYQKILK